jgi:hypothetical protein
MGTEWTRRRDVSNNMQTVDMYCQCVYGVDMSPAVADGNHRKGATSTNMTMATTKRDTLDQMLPIAALMMKRITWEHRYAG